MAYQSWSVVFGEQPSAAKWNILGTNDSSFNDGTGIATETILSSHLAPTIINKNCSGDTTINSGSDTDITGATATFTPAIASYAIVLGVFDFKTNSTANDLFSGLLDVDGSNQSAIATWKVPTSGGQGTIPQLWLVSLSAVSHTLKLQALRVSGSGSSVVAATNSHLTIFLYGDNNVTAS